MNVLTKLERKMEMLFWACIAALMSRSPQTAMALIKFRRNNKGITGTVIALIVALVALGVIIPVGLLVTANIYTTVSDMNLGTSGNATRTTLFANIWSAYDLSAIVPIVAAAGVIIAIIVAAFAFRSKT